MLTKFDVSVHIIEVYYIDRWIIINQSIMHITGQTIIKFMKQLEVDIYSFLFKFQISTNLLYFTI